LGAESGLLKNLWKNDVEKKDLKNNQGNVNFQVTIFIV